MFGKPLVMNVFRSQLAEAIVALALEPEWQWSSADYAGWDFQNGSNLRLEVKSAAAKQSWLLNRDQQRSAARFDIATRDQGRGLSFSLSSPVRPANIYIFAYHPVEDDSADHRDPMQWDFYCAPTNKLPAQKTIGLGPLSQIAIKCRFEGLSVAIKKIADQLSLDGTR